MDWEELEGDGLTVLWPGPCLTVGPVKAGGWSASSGVSVPGRHLVRGLWPVVAEGCGLWPLPGLEFLLSLRASQGATPGPSQRPLQT